MSQTNQHTAPTSRRKAILEGLLKAIDVMVGVVAVVAGIFALLATPPSIIREVSIPLLVWLWGGFLIFGGISAGLGRLIGIWILETAGIAAMGTGALIYLVVVSTAIGDELGVIVASCLILMAILNMARRYVELQMFLSEPGEKSWVDRFREAVQVRTAPRA